jgi:hypothetical protein
MFFVPILLVILVVVVDGSMAVNRLHASYTG